MNPARWRGLFWERSRPWRLRLRRWRRLTRRLPGRGRGGLRIEIGEVAAAPRASDVVRGPVAILVRRGAEVSTAALERFLARQTVFRQTETSQTADAECAPFLFLAHGALDELPPTHLEALLLVAASEDLDFAVLGWAAPAASPDPAVDPAAPRFAWRAPEDVDAASLTLWRRPDAARPPRPMLGKRVAQVGGALAEAEQSMPPSCVAVGPYLLAPESGPGVYGHRVLDPHAVLAALPAEPPPVGGDAALFVLPFLARGGAERLLFDVLAGLAGRHRLLVVTLEPHRAELGDTLDEARRLTPHVYTLGDWLPRAALPGALAHLLRRWSVSTLIGWNPCTDLLDHLVDLRRIVPDLRVLLQLYHHEGGWIDRLGPRLLDAIDLHLAPTGRLAETLEHRLGVAPERIARLRHAVPPPPVRSESEIAARRRERRRELGIEEEALVVGTIARLHPQKRPGDVLELARRFARRRDAAARSVRFVLVGGGPLDAEIDRDLARDRPPNLIRLPLVDDPEPLYDAFDLCLLPSNFEGLPLFLLEGLARGLPCVATAVGEIPVLLESGGGVLVERPGDLDSLEAAIDTLADPLRRAAEAERGRRVVAERYRLEDLVRRYEELLFPPCVPSPSGEDISPRSC